MQMLRAHLVEHRRPADVVALFDEEPNELGDAVRRSHRIAEGDPGAALHAVHDESVTLAR